MFKFSTMILALSCLAGLPGSAQAQPALRLEELENFGNVLEFLRDQIKPDRVDHFTDARYRQVDQEVRSILDWSGAPGVAISVPFARSRHEPNYVVASGNDVIVLGPGKTITDAVVRWYDEPRVVARAPEGFDYSASDSYYVFATRTADGGVRYTPQLREATDLTNRQVRDAMVDSAVVRAGERAADIELMIAMLKHYQQTAADAAEKDRASRLRTDLAALRDRIARNEETLARELERQRQLQNAAAFVDRLSAVLQFSTVLASTIATIPRDDARSIADAKSPEDLKNILQDRLRAAAGNIDSVRSASETDKRAYGLSWNETRAVIESGGEPKELVIRVKSFQP